MNTFDSKFWKSIGAFSVVIAIICFFPYLFTTCSVRNIDFSDTGQVGDTIGGIMTPFIAIAASLLTFFAFWVQYKANLQQREQFEIQLNEQKAQFETQLKEQKSQVETELAHQRSVATEQEKVWNIERFEGKYYELLRLHRANVEEIQIAGGTISGRKSFVSMFYELKFIYHSLEVIHQDKANKLFNSAYTTEQLSNIAYKVFFYGIGENSNNILLNFFSDEEKSILNLLIIDLTIIQNDFSKEKSKFKGESFLYQHPVATANGLFTLKTRYFPFDGHSTKLGHYFRHLFQTVEYVANSRLFEFGEKYKYLKTLRAQLSNHEQLLLYYNALSDFGKKWISKKYITNFKLVRNMPLPAADFGIIPEDKFQNEITSLRLKGKELFEWHEMMKN